MTKKTLTFVTGNEKKLQEASDILSPLGITIKSCSCSLEEIQSDSPEEVVIDKAQRAFNKIGKALIVDDTALFIDGYENFPGTYTKAMARLLGAKGLDRLIDENHRATFTSYICYYDEKPKLFKGSWHGTLLKGKALQSSQWPFNSMFLPDDAKVVLSEMPWAERVKKSHRYKALTELAKYFEGKK